MQGKRGLCDFDPNSTVGKIPEGNRLSEKVFRRAPCERNKSNQEDGWKSRFLNGENLKGEVFQEPN